MISTPWPFEIYGILEIWLHYHMPLQLGVEWRVTRRLGGRPQLRASFIRVLHSIGGGGGGGGGK